MFQKIILLFSLFFCVELESQKESNLWFFPIDRALDFNSVPPSPYLNYNNTYGYIEGYSVVCDKFGKLLFYSDGNHVWDLNHELFPNGSGTILSPLSTSIQGCTVIKSSTNNSHYFLISLNDLIEPSKGELFISTIDMSLRNDLGDIILNSTKPIGTNFTEHLLILPHPCGGVWIVAHERQNNRFRSIWIFDGNILSNTPTNIGENYAIISGSLGSFEGSITLSSSNKIGVVNSAGMLEFFQFDPFSGKISDNINLYPSNLSNRSGYTTGIFSPNGQFFYTVGRDATEMWIEQYDLKSNIASEIKNSLVKLPIPAIIRPGKSALTLGIDQKIYLVTSAKNYTMGVINQPNEKGNDCDFEPEGIDMGGRYTAVSFPAPLVFETPKITNFLPADTVSCSALNLSAQSNILYDSIKWSTGASNPTIQLQSSGNYQAELFKDGCVYQDSIKVEINYFQNEVTEAICENDVYNYKGVDYYAGDVIIDSIKGVNETCDTALSITVSRRDLIQAEQSIAICEGDSFTGEDGISYIVGDTVKVRRVGQNGQCDSLVSKVIKGITLPSPTISGQEVICFGARTDLTASSHKSYLWNTGATTSSINVGSGDYEVKVVDTLDCNGEAKITIIERPDWLIDILDTMDVVSGESYTLQLMGDKSRINSVEIIPSENLVDFINGNLDISIRGESALYKLIFKDDIGCLVEQDIYLNVSKEEEIIAPNIIRLNAMENANRVWNIHLGANLTFEEAAIFDRWGNQVFFTKDASATWNGSFGGKTAGSGVYFYVIKAKNKAGRVFIKRGDIAVVE